MKDLNLVEKDLIEQKTEFEDAKTAYGDDISKKAGVEKWKKNTADFSKMVSEEYGAGKWKSLALTTDGWVPGFIQDMIDALEDLKEVIRTLASILELLIQLVQAALDPILAALKALMEQIVEQLESLLQDMGAYMLYVPIQKRFETQFADLGDLTGWADNLKYKNTFSVFAPQNPAVIENPSLQSFMTQANRYSGGNYGFFNTVMGSLYDEGDISRPTFTNENDYVGGMVIVLGTDLDPFGWLDDLWMLLGLFGDLFASTPNKIPKPSGLTARTISQVRKGSLFPSITGGTPNPLDYYMIQVLLKWDAMGAPVARLTDLGGVIILPERYAIIRVRDDVHAMFATSVLDLMNTRELSVGLKNLNAEVIVEDAYTPLSTSYLDDQIPAAQDTSYYYAVAYKLKGYNPTASIPLVGPLVSEDNPPSEEGRELGYWYLSNVVRVTPYPTLPASTPPDWVRTPSLEQMFPALAQLLRQFIAELEMWVNKILGVGDLLSQYLAFLLSEVARYEALAETLISRIQRILEMLKIPPMTIGGMYMRTFFGKGGNMYFLQDLAASLAEGFKDAPPFHKGTEYVTGIVMLSGGPQFVVEGFINLLALLFGSPSNGMQQMFLELGGAIDAVEQKYFGDSFGREAKPKDTTISLNDALQPVIECGAPEKPMKTFGTDFAPIPVGV